MINSAPQLSQLFVVVSSKLRTLLYFRSDLIEFSFAHNSVFEETHND